MGTLDRPTADAATAETRVGAEAAPHPPRPRGPSVLARVGLVVVAALAADLGMSWVRWNCVGIRMRARMGLFVPWEPFAPRCVLSSEVTAISTLHNFESAQRQFRSAAAADEDGDRVGECGSFAELSGVAPVRGARALACPVLSGAFRNVSAAGEVRRSGYVFRLWLVAKGGTPVSPGPAGAPAGTLDPDACETTWCAYAWPTRFDRSGLRTFFVAADGSLWATEDARYDGPGRGPAPGAAFTTGGVGSILGPPPGGGLYGTGREVVGQDGNVWRQVH